jgi:hypothetical protein
VKEEERVLHGGGWAPFIAARGGGRWQCGGGETVDREMVAVRPWVRARRQRPLSGRRQS